MPDYVPRLGSWFSSRLEAPELKIIRVRDVAGGLVNHVCRVDIRRTPETQAESFLLRIDPVIGPYAPYDMRTQYDRFVRLEQTGLPVPEPLFLETDPAIIGHDFWVSKFVEGETPGRLLDPDAPDGRRRLRAYVDALAGVHAANWSAVGLDLLCPPLDRDALHDRLAKANNEIEPMAAEDRALFGKVAKRLIEKLPATFPMRLTHGDCSLSNYIFRDGEVAAIVDWDLARITDPVADLGYYCAIHHRFQMALAPALREARLAPVIEAYRSRCNEDLSSLPFWELFQTWSNGVSWVRPGWKGQAGGFRAYRDRLAELIDQY